MAIDLGTLLLSVAGSGGIAGVITGVVAMPRSARSEIRDVNDKADGLRRDLTKCERNCTEALADAARARMETDDWRRRCTRLEEESDRYRLEADHWRARFDQAHQKGPPRD